MTTNARLDSLFAAWRRKPAYRGIAQVSFGRDGILDEDLWNKSSRKIMFVLKDANGAYSDDLRTDWKCTPWRILSLWTYGLENMTKDNVPSFKEAERGYEDSLFHRTAIINLKKEVGTSRTNMAQLERYIVEDRKEILEEIRIIGPDIVVCGGTFSVVRRLFVDEIDASSGELAGCFFLWSTERQERKVPWINSWHPSYFARSFEDKYNRLMENAHKAFF